MAEHSQVSTEQATFGDTVFEQLFQTFVEPNIKERIEKGESPNPFPLSSLRGVQIVFFPDGRKPTVRINSEVRAIAEIRPRAGIEVKTGEPVSFDQIESFGVIGLTEEEADYGHATFIRQPDGSWIGYFDFTYYKGRARRHLDVAEEFLHAAQYCRERHAWVAFADTLFSAAELAAKASIYCLDGTGEIATSRKHQTVKANFNKQRAIGNVDDAHSTALNRLWELRQKGRYVEKDVTFREDDADGLLADIRSLIGQSRSRASTFKSTDGGT